LTEGFVIESVQQWMLGEGLFGIIVILLALLATGVFLERESTRPDALVRVIYLREGLLVLPRLAITVGVASPVLGAGMQALTYLLLWVVAAFTILRPSSNSSGRILWLAALAISVSAIATDLTVTDIEPARNALQDQLTFALLVTALWRTPRLNAVSIIRYAKLVIGVMLVSSVLAIAAGLPAALHDPHSTIPVIGRWSGTFTHPNAYGPAGVLYLVLERLQPSRLSVRVPMVGAALVAIVLSQSKTAWAAALIVGTILAVAGWPRRRAGFAALAATSLAALGALTLDAERFDVDGTPLGTVSTLTGRTELWALGLERWQQSPWFGAGSGVFLDIANRTGQEWAGQAHNAYVAALAENGIVGLCAAIGYLGALGVIAWRHAAATRNASLALLALLLVRTITETPLMHFGYEELTILALAFAWERDPPPPVAPGLRRKGVSSRRVPGWAGRQLPSNLRLNRPGSGGAS
jgi:O-antigen ligase